MSKKKYKYMAASAARIQRKQASLSEPINTGARPQGSRASQGSHPSQGSRKGFEAANDSHEVRLSLVENQMDKNVATKADVSDLRGDVGAGFERLDGKVDKVGHKLDGKIDSENEKIRGEMKAGFEQLDGKVETENEKLKVFILKTILGVIGGALGLVATTIYIYINWPSS